MNTTTLTNPLLRSESLPDVYSSEGILAWGRAHPALPSGVSLINAGGITPVECWAEGPRDHATTIDFAEVELLRTAQGVMHLVEARRTADFDPLAQVPGAFCCIPLAIEQLRGTVDAMDTPALQDFIRTVFNVPVIFYRYWTAPAGAHHAYPGGLIEHSLHVMEIVQRTLRKQALADHGVEPAARDLALTAALLHDVGKTAAYDAQGGRTDHCRRIGHELLGVELLWPALLAMRQESPLLADGLHVLLTNRTYFTESPLPLRRLSDLLRWADNKSAANAGAPQD